MGIIMKTVIRLFFRTLRRIIGPIMLFVDWLTTPKGIQRPAREQEKIDQNTQNMALYQFKTCPFCIKVRRHTKRLSLNIETRDAQHDPTSRTQLLTGGGVLKVPCLKVTNEAGEVIAIGKSKYDVSELADKPIRDFFSYVRVLI